MTVDEALELIEIVLNYQRLNKVQELVFRQSWEGRSYKEIAGNLEYEYDYIKDAGAKLWKLLSEAFGEKVKKDNIQSVIRRYLRRTQVSFNRNQMIEVNLSGANLSGASLSLANLSVEKPLLKNSNNPVSFEEDLQKLVDPNNKTELIEEENQQEIQSNSEEQIYHWNGLDFCSEAQVKIAEALDRANILFIPNFKIRLTSTEGRENKQVDFLIFDRGKSGILEIDYLPSQVDKGDFRESDIATRRYHDRIFQTHGISLIQYYDPTKCSTAPEQVVQEFLERLSQSEK